MRIDGAEAFDLAGSTVAGAGDVNDDGRDDVIIGAPVSGDGQPDPGKAYVIFGRATFADVDLAALGSAGFRIDGAAADDRAGSSVAGAGDVNGDGIDDVVVGAPLADPGMQSAAGSTYVVYGRTTPVNVSLATLAAAGFRVDGAFAGEQAGRSVAGAGDFNGDGNDDVVVGAPLTDCCPATDSGAAYVVYGADGDPADFDLADVGGSAAARAMWVDGAAAGDQTGRTVAGAGDFNGDGRDDVVVGAPFANPGSEDDAGSAYVIYGAAGDPADFDLASTAARAMRVDGAFAGEWAGMSVAGAGDFNGDGIDDVVVGAPRTNCCPAALSGSAYVVYGAAGDPADFDFVDVGGSAAGRTMWLNGAAAGDETGASVAGAGDVNGDGRDDVIVGAHAASNNARAQSGSAYVVHGALGDQPDLHLAGILGASARGLRLDGAAPGDFAGGSVAGAGDVDGDGRDDVLVAAVLASANGRVESGSTYVPSLLHQLAVARQGAGSGSVTGPGIDCGADCGESYYHGTTVALSAIAAAGSTFSGWSGACSGTGGCAVTLDADRAVLAAFTPVPSGGTPGDGGGVAPGGEGGPGGGTTPVPPPAFGASTLVTLRLARSRIPARGPVRVRVANANGFEVAGRLSGRTVGRVSTARRRVIRLRARSFRVAAQGRTTVRLSLPRTLRRLLARSGRLRLRVSARVVDPAGNARTVGRRVTPRLRTRRR